MITAERWKELHDATLESIELRWSSGEVVVRIRTGDTTQHHRVLVASSVRRLQCDRQMPWGLSASINEIRGPTSAGDDVVLEIEMQSGDRIRIEAGAFTLRDRE